MALRIPASRSPVWVLIETATSAVFSLVSMLVIGRVIGPEATGTGMVAIAAFLLLDVAGATIFTDAVVQHRQLDRTHAASAVTGATLVGLTAGLILALGSPLLSHMADAPSALPLCLALAPLLPVSAFAGASSGLVLRQHRFALLASRVLLGQPLALGIGLVLAATGFGPWAMIANQVVATVASFLLVTILGRLGIRPTLSWAALRDLWPVAGPQVLALFVMIGRYRIFLLCVGFVASEVVLAICHFAFRMLDAALVMVWQSTSRIALPRLSALQRDRAALADAYGELAQLQALLGMPLALGIALTAPDLVQALLGPAWSEAAGAAQVVGFAATLSFLQGDYPSLFVAIGKARRNLQVAALSTAVPLVALLVFQPETPTGVAICWASQSIVMPPFLIWTVLRELRRSPLWLAKRVAPAVLAAMCMAAVVVTQEIVVKLPAAQELILAAVLGGVTYLGIAWIALGGRLPNALRRGARPIAAT